MNGARRGPTPGNGRGDHWEFAHAQFVCFTNDASITGIAVPDAALRGAIMMLPPTGPAAGPAARPTSWPTSWPTPRMARALMAQPEQPIAAMIGYLRNVVLAPPVLQERGHAIFFSPQRAWLGEAGFGLGTISTLQLRIRGLMAEALRLDAGGIILAHNHPSGQCQPSGCDITATRRLQDIAQALDITLIDHLIFTAEAVYSMRAGGLL